MIAEKYLTLDNSNYTRGNESKHFFFNRVVNVWNKLPRNIIKCTLVEVFNLQFMTNQNVIYTFQAED